MSREPISTRPRLWWDNDFEVEGEVRRCVDTFSEHDPSAFLPFRRRHQDCDVAKRTFRLIAHAVVAAATSADDGVVALVGPILASNGYRVPGAQLRRTIEENGRCYAGGVRRRQTEGDNEHGSQDQRPRLRTSHHGKVRRALHGWPGRVTPSFFGNVHDGPRAASRMEQNPT
jgi:hypothetical protein